MNNISYDRYRFHPDIIKPAVWLYFRFALSYRDVEDLLAERGIDGQNIEHAGKLWLTRCLL